MISLETRSEVLAQDTVTKIIRDTLPPKKHPYDITTSNNIENLLVT